MPVPVPVRDPDILDDIQARLKAIGLFDNVYRSALPEDRGQSASDNMAAAVAMNEWQEIDDADDGPNLRLQRTVRWTLTLFVREDDPQVRERKLDKLLAASQKALDGKSLAGVTVPDWTRLRRGTYQTPASPEQRMTVAGDAIYWVEGDVDPNYFDT